MSPTWRSPLGGLIVAFVSSCSSPDTTARVDPIGPDRPSFPPVAAVLVRHCGSLDCHGSPKRNMRLYGYGGLRLARADGGVVLPEDRQVVTEEVDADYEAVIGVEPEKMRDVVQRRGAGADDLTLVRKARGEEEHKGLQNMTTGDDVDWCILVARVCHRRERLQACRADD